MEIYGRHFKDDIAQYDDVFNNELKLEYKLFAPISCIKQDKIDKIYKKAYDFIPELQNFVLDDFGDKLLDIVQSNAKLGGLDTDDLKLILEEWSIKEMVDMYKEAERNIYFAVVSEFQNAGNSID